MTPKERAEEIVIICEGLNNPPKLVHYIVKAIGDAVEEAVKTMASLAKDDIAAEREACAKVAEIYFTGTGHHEAAGHTIAEAIRNRK